MTQPAQTWANGAEGGTPLSANRLNNMEGRISAVGDRQYINAMVAGLVEDEFSDAHAAIAALATRSDLVVNVLDYGAVGDGVADDTAKIQAALNAATFGSVVRIPPGTYKFTTTAVVGAGVTIDATGAQMVGYFASGDQRFLANGTPGATPTGYTGNGDITIIGGIWDCRGHLNGATYASGFSFAHAERITLRDVTFRNICYGHAVELCALRRVRVINCRAEGYTVGSSAPRDTEAFQVESATAAGFPLFGAYDNTPCVDVLILGCYVGPSTACGLWPKAVGDHGGLAGVKQYGIRVVGCHFETSNYGLAATNWADFTISSNRASGGGFLIRTMAGDECGPGVIANNTVRDAAAYGIATVGLSGALVRGVAISGNTVSGGGVSALRVEWAQQCVVAGNAIRDSAPDSMSLVSSSRVAVTGNTTYRGGGHAATVFNCSEVVLVGNIITEPGQHGISVSGTAANHAIRGNTVIGASYATDNTYAGIRIGGGSNAQLVGNTVRRGAAVNRGLYGLQIVAAATGTWHVLNDLRDGGTTPLSDDGTSSVTSTADLIA